MGKVEGEQDASGTNFDKYKRNGEGKYRLKWLICFKNRNAYAFDNS
jgi:hypothetical protein